MSRTILDLGTTRWQLGQAPRQPFSSQLRDDRAAVTEWLPARVPGDVRADLLAAGRIPPLDTPEGIAASEWVDDVDWWCRTEIDACEPGMTLVLEADGIDYISAAWLDGQLLATHQGMFARQSIVLPSLISTPGKHELAVRVWGAGALPPLPNPPLRRVVRRLVTGLGLRPEYFPGRMATPKAQFSFGWDFAPRILSTGIWDGVRLVHCRGACLSDIQAQAEPLSEADPTRVKWEVRVQLTRLRADRLSVRLELRSPGGDPVPLSQEMFDLGDAQDSLLIFDSAPMARWWPWDQGYPNLYRLTVRLFDERGSLDELETMVGVRTVRRERFPNGQPWRFTVNDRPVFLRGANWVPADILPGQVTGEDYARLVGLARGAGINFLRVWGGGIREKEAFWRQCNRLGIMVMQEFPLACALLDHYPRDPAYLAVLDSEARGIIRALRNHPSLIAWCGGNEISTRRERLPLRTIERVLEREDAARPWIPASPSQGDVHQWDVWHGRAPWQSFSRVIAPFMSEFGLQALPSIETIQEMFGPCPPPLGDPQWATRKLQATKAGHYATLSAAQDLVATIEATQRSQAAGLQTAIEACRLRREGSGHPHPCGGLAFWQFNEPWPVVSWSVVDRQGRPKAAYDMLLHSYQPLLVAARFQWRKWRRGDQFEAELWLVNDTPERFDGCSVEASVDGRTAFQSEVITTVKPACALRAGSMHVPLDAPPSSLELICVRDGVIIARNLYDLGVYLPPPQPLHAWLMRRAADLLLQID